MCRFVFFFFKQKTAYEMRISDWSSDVCSSDLQYYGEQLPPREIILDREIEDVELLQDAFSAAAGRRVQVKTSVRGDRAGYLDLARRNAEMTLATELGSQAAQRARVESLRDMLGLADLPQRIECFDISHTLGDRKSDG